MSADLYTIELSHPGRAAQLMLAHKGIDYRTRVLPAGLQPLALRAAGFRGYTVPALKLDGRRVQGSLEIAQELERFRPQPSLYEGDRRAIESAERWAEAELQPLSRRFFRFTLAEQYEGRKWIARVSRLPAPGLQARNVALVRAFARAADARPERVREELAALPDTLDRVDALVADGIITLEPPNAATFQALTSLRGLCLFEQLRPLVEARPAGRLAVQLIPEWPTAPVSLPDAWLPAGS